MSAGAPATAMVLAAGLGTRMRPANDAVPKPLVQLAGRALIDHVLDRLAAAGVKRAVVNLHYMADKLETHLAGRKAPAIVFSDERDAILDTGGGVARALPLLAAEHFFIHNADSVWVEGAAPTLERMAAQWDPERMDALLLLAPVQNAVGYAGPGDFAMDARGRLARRGEHEVVPFAFAGVSIAHRRLLEGFPDNAFSLNRLWDRALEAGRLFGIRHDGIWMHVGTPEALARAEAVLGGDDGPR